MAGLTATTNAPKTEEELRSLLANDNKVKVAGAFLYLDCSYSGEITEL